MYSFAKTLGLYFRYHDVKPGDVISARVVSVSSETVTLRSGLKSDAYVPRHEFCSNNKNIALKIGDLVPVLVEDLGIRTGRVIVSYEKAKKIISWRILEKAFHKEECVDGLIVRKVKGGMTVMVNGMRAFLPGSLIDMRPVKDSEKYEGKKFKFHIIKLDKQRNNVVLSRRSVLESKYQEKRTALIATLKDGEIVKGVVKNITDYGVFIDLGGLDGLLHITDISWRRIKHPGNVVSLGDTITVKVLKFDRTKNRVSLGLKQLHSDPWDGVIERYPPGRKVRGKITNITDYGAFVEIEPGIEGLVHISEMDWKNKFILPHKLLKIGQLVSVSIIDISKTRRRISLGMKHRAQSPWLNLLKVHQKHDKFNVIAKAKTKLGILVKLPMCLGGLICLSKFYREAIFNTYNRNGIVEASLISVNVNNGFIKLFSEEILRNKLLKTVRQKRCNAGSIIRQVNRIRRRIMFRSCRKAGSGRIVLHILYNITKKLRAIKVIIIERQHFIAKLKHYFTATI